MSRANVSATARFGKFLETVNTDPSGTGSNMAIELRQLIRTLCTDAVQHISQKEMKPVLDRHLGRSWLELHLTMFGIWRLLQKIDEDKPTLGRMNKMGLAKEDCDKISAYFPHVKDHLKTALNTATHDLNVLGDANGRVMTDEKRDICWGLAQDETVKRCVPAKKGDMPHCFFKFIDEKCPECGEPQK